MGLIDFILNLAGLLLWLNWRSVPFDPLSRTTPATLVGTLRRAEPQRLKRWHFLAALGGLILIRALLYWQIGPAVDWTASVKLVAISISFRSDFLGRMLLFSVSSFGITLAVFFLWLLFLSILNCSASQTDSLQKLVRLQLGLVDRWPGAIKLSLPLLVGGVSWWLLSWPLAHWQIVPRPVSAAHRLEQAALIGLGSYFAWKYLIAGLLTLHLVNSYVYLGNHPVWNYADAAARRLLSQLQRVPLRVGKVDFSPVVGMAVVFIAAELAAAALTKLYGHLQL